MMLVKLWLAMLILFIASIITGTIFDPPEGGINTFWITVLFCVVDPVALVLVILLIIARIQLSSATALVDRHGEMIPLKSYSLYWLYFHDRKRWLKNSIIIALPSVLIIGIPVGLFISLIISLKGFVEFFIGLIFGFVFTIALACEYYKWYSRRFL